MLSANRPPLDQGPDTLIQVQIYHHLQPDTRLEADQVIWLGLLPICTLVGQQSPVPAGTQDTSWSDNVPILVLAWALGETCSLLYPHTALCLPSPANSTLESKPGIQVLGKVLQSRGKVRPGGLRMPVLGTGLRCSMANRWKD